MTHSTFLSIIALLRFLLGVISTKVGRGQEVLDYRARLSPPSDGSIERSVVSFGKYKSVTIDHNNYPPISANWRKSWPDGIKLISSNFQSDSSNNIQGRVLANNSWVKSTDSTSNINSKYSNQESFERTTNISLKPKLQTFSWSGDFLLISFKMSPLSDVSSSRLLPPITWLSASGSKVKVLYNTTQSESSQTDIPISAEMDSDRLIEVTVQKKMAEESLSALRMNGFQREDIYRMLDKGPWILAFDISTVLLRTYKDLQSSLGVTQSQFVHILSHCPYLLAQYCRYKGRDLHATVMALLEVDSEPLKTIKGSINDDDDDEDEYEKEDTEELTETDSEEVLENQDNNFEKFTTKKQFQGIVSNAQREQVIRDIMRFPSMLAAPPDRILGWRSLMQAHSVASTPVGRFGRFMRKAPFMYYVNPPQLFDLHMCISSSNEEVVPITSNEEDSSTVSNESSSKMKTYDIGKASEKPPPPNSRTVTTASGFVAYESLSVLSYLQEVLNDNSHMDKVVRTQPTILLTSLYELSQRVTFLRNLLRRVSTENLKRSKQLDIDKTNFDEFIAYVRPNTTTPMQGFEVKSSLPSLAGTRTNSKNYVDDILQDNYMNNNRGVYKMVTSLPSVATQNKPSQHRTSFATAQSDDRTKKLDSTATTYSTARPQQVRSHQSDLTTSNGKDVGLSEDVIRRMAEQKALLALVLAYPAILSVESSRMSDAYNGLLSLGASEADIERLVMRNPRALTVNAARIRAGGHFLKQYCGFSKTEIIPFMMKCPAVLNGELSELQQKVKYLYKSLGASSYTLKKFPGYLSFDLPFIISRAEFLRAMGKDPCFRGLQHLLQSSAKQLSSCANVTEDVFNAFQRSFTEKLARRNAHL